MKTKIVYILVSTPEDLYYEQLILSLYSLRKHNPTTIVDVLVDESTASNIESRSIKLLDYVNEVRTIETPEDFTNMQKNRYIKTNLRKYVEGDFLYIDSDTIICESLEDLDSLKCDLGAVVDAHGVAYPSNVIKYLQNISHMMNWDDILGTTLYNGGLMYAKDTPVAHRFYELWHNYWLECVQKGYNRDQLSLRKTVHDYPVVEKISDVWNCMIKDHGAPYLRDAKIVHYFYETSNTSYIASLNSIFVTIKECGYIPPIVEDFVCAPKRMICNADEFLFLESSDSIQQIFRDDHRLFKILMLISKWYICLKNSTRHLRSKFYHILER